MTLHIGRLLVPQRDPSISFRFAAAWVASIFLAALTVQTAAGEQVQITIVLDEAGRYNASEFVRQCNRELGSNLPVNPGRDDWRLLTPAEEAALRLANELGVVQAEFHPNRIVLTLPKPDSPEARRQARDRIRKWFGIPDDRWRPDQGLHVPEKMDAARPLLLLIHGLEAGPPDFARFQEACRATGVQLLTFDYPNDGPLAEAGDRLSDELKELARRRPDLRLAIVGHSMGGLIARYVVETPDKNPGCATDLFLLGTPNRGSRLAGEYAFAELAIQVTPTGWRGLRSSMTDGLGEAADDLGPGSPFLKALNARPKPAGVRYHIGIGTRSVLNAEQQAAILGDLTRIMAARGTPPREARRWIDLLSAEELADGRGDGAVAVASARLKGADGERTFSLNHAELLSLPGDRPASSDVFQWITAQMGWRLTAGDRNE